MFKMNRFDPSKSNNGQIKDHEIYTNIVKVYRIYIMKKSKRKQDLFWQYSSTFQYEL